MKKLMIAVGAAALCGAVSYADVTSANVVGFQNIPIQVGYTIFAPTFDGVGKSLDLQDIKLDGAPGVGTDMIWVLNEDGMVTGDIYYWLDAAITETTSYWSADGATPLEGVSITAGQGFYIYTEESDVKAVVSGEVKIGPYSKDLDFGYNLTGNFCPVALDIQNIKLEGVDGAGTDMIWILNEDGMVTGDIYYWLDAAITETTSYWSADGATPLEGITVQPGEGLYLYTESTTGKITLPAVIPAK